MRIPRYHSIRKNQVCEILNCYISNIFIDITVIDIVVTDKKEQFHLISVTAQILYIRTMLTVYKLFETT